jgi:hypothetical protein
MPRTLRPVALGAALALVLAPALAHAQPPGLPAQPVPVAPQQPPGITTVPPIALPPHNDPVVPATPQFLPAEPDPLRPAVSPESSRCAPAGFYGLLEISVLFPELRGFLSGPVTIAGINDVVAISSASLDATGSPRVEIGYRLPDGIGAVALGYRSIVSRGTDTIDGFDFLGPGFLTSRLNVNVVDLDYASPAFNFAPYWDFAFRVGLRGAAFYFDDTITGQFIQQHASSNFLGGGPHATLEVGRALDLIPGLALTSKLDGAVLIGETSQSFEETAHTDVLGAPPGSMVGGASRLHGTQVVPTLTFTIGLSYSPPGMEKWLRFGFGYQYEYWWDIGTRGDSRGDFEGNGLYFRGEFNF